MLLIALSALTWWVQSEETPLIQKGRIVPRLTVPCSRAPTTTNRSPLWQSALTNWLFSEKWLNRRTSRTVVPLLFWAIVLSTLPLTRQCRLTTVMGTLCLKAGLAKQWTLGRNTKGRNLPILRACSLLRFSTIDIMVQTVAVKLLLERARMLPQHLRIVLLLVPLRPPRVYWWELLSWGLLAYGLTTNMALPLLGMWNRVNPNLKAFLVTSSARLGARPSRAQLNLR